jgi:hypothetical protein
MLYLNKNDVKYEIGGDVINIADDCYPQIMRCLWR